MACGYWGMEQLSAAHAHHGQSAIRFNFVPHIQIDKSSI
jgi:hypothetical protein